MRNSNKDNVLRPKKRQIVRVAWVLIVLNILIMLPAWLPGNDHIRDPAIEALLTHPTPEAIGGTIGYCIASCLMPIIALILGRVAWKRHQDVGGQTVVIVGVISIGFSLLSVFLPTSESGKQLMGRVKDQYTTDSTTPDFPEYVSDKHGFAVRFPEEPIVTSIVEGMVHYAAEGEVDGAVYSVGVGSLDYSTSFDTDAFLDRALQGRLKVLGDKSRLIQSNKVLFLGYEALDYEYSGRANNVTVYFKGIIFVTGVGKLMYTVDVVCTEETKAIAYDRYNDFIKSFSLRD